MAVSIAVVCEADPDRRIACGLADRLILEEAHWITAEVIAGYREYRGYERSTSFLRWSGVKSLAAERRIRSHGHFSGSPGAPDALAARRALLLLKTAPAPPDAVLLIRDDDRQSQRRTGLEQARNEAASNWTIPVVIGLAHISRECWVLTGFTPSNDEECSRLDELKRELGFDPARHASRLDAKPETAKQNAKRVLRLLIPNSREREEQCWLATDLKLLAERGQEVGLTDYLNELRDRLLQAFGAASP
jgi:hypothetical protein